MKYFSTLLIILLILCTPPSVINQNYKYDKKEYSLSILPCNVQSKLDVDSFFIDMFNGNKLPNQSSFVDPVQVKQLAQTNNQLWSILMKITVSDNSIADTSNNLRRFLSEDELSQLYTFLKSTDLLLIPQIYISSNSGYTQASSFTRLYDLRNGELIYQKTNSNSMSDQGKTGPEFLIFMQLGMIRNDFKELFINRFLTVSTY